jgi:hypothetical protein
MDLEDEPLRERTLMGTSDLGKLLYECMFRGESAPLVLHMLEAIGVRIKLSLTLRGRGLSRFLGTAVGVGEDGN